MPRGKKRYYNGELEYDPSPLYRCEVDKNGKVRHWMAFDPQHGPESQEQIDYYQEESYPGSEDWELHEPIVKIPKRKPKHE
jgi:hypothetical protein